MPEGALQALPLLDRALALEPDYGLAHGYVAHCHEYLFVRAGRREETVWHASGMPMPPLPTVAMTRWR